MSLRCGQEPRLDEYDTGIFFLPFLTLLCTMYMLIQCNLKGKQMLTSTITEKGQTTIPAEVRKALSLKPHQRLTYEICEGGVVVRPETENLMDLAGSLKSAVASIDEKISARHEYTAQISARRSCRALAESVPPFSTGGRPQVSPRSQRPRHRRGRLGPHILL
jgi:antitoxin PrlF